MIYEWSTVRIQLRTIHICFARSLIANPVFMAILLQLINLTAIFCLYSELDFLHLFLSHWHSYHHQCNPNGSFSKQSNLWSEHLLKCIWVSSLCSYYTDSIHKLLPFVGISPSFLLHLTFSYPSSPFHLWCVNTTLLSEWHGYSIALTEEHLNGDICIFSVIPSTTRTPVGCCNDWRTIGQMGNYSVMAKLC